jgi:hypothetical protein
LRSILRSASTASEPLPTATTNTARGSTAWKWAVLQGFLPDNGRCGRCGRYFPDLYLWASDHSMCILLPERDADAPSRRLHPSLQERRWPGAVSCTDLLPDDVGDYLAAHGGDLGVEGYSIPLLVHHFPTLASSSAWSAMARTTTKRQSART